MKNVSKKNLDFLDKIRISHRGLFDKNNPENSIGAFKNSIKKGVPIELDVHILKDNTVIVFHDADTKRMTDKLVVLKDSVYDDIKDLKLKNTGYGIPKFIEVLELVDGDVLLDIEIKYDVKNFKICREVCKYLDNYKGNFIVKSFNPMYVVWFRIFRPNYVRGLLVSGNKGQNIRNKMWFCFLKWFNVFMKMDFLAFDYRFLPNRSVDKIKKSGIPVLLYTIKGDNKVKYKDYSYIYEE